MTGKEFSKWMDEIGLSISEAARFFGVSEQTVYNWRSTRGVADSKADWVRHMMRTFVKERGVSELPERLTLEVPPAQFDRWCNASLREGMIPREWAIKTLDAAAESAGLTTEQGHADDLTGSYTASDPVGSDVPIAAEDPGNYPAGGATPGAPFQAPRTRDSA